MRFVEWSFFDCYRNIELSNIAIIWSSLVLIGIFGNKLNKVPSNCERTWCVPALVLCLRIVQLLAIRGPILMSSLKIFIEFLKSIIRETLEFLAWQILIKVNAGSLEIPAAPWIFIVENQDIFRREFPGSNPTSPCWWAPLLDKIVPAVLVFLDLLLPIFKYLSTVLIMSKRGDRGW